MNADLEEQEQKRLIELLKGKISRLEEVIADETDLIVKKLLEIGLEVEKYNLLLVEVDEGKTHKAHFVIAPALTQIVLAGVRRVSEEENDGEGHIHNCDNCPKAGDCPIEGLVREKKEKKAREAKAKWN
jgi:hypothetical protein